MAAYVTGEKENVVVSVKAETIMAGEAIQAFMKEHNYEKINEWAVEPSFHNPHFLNIYKGAYAIDEMTQEELEEAHSV